MEQKDRLPLATEHRNRRLDRAMLLARSDFHGLGVTATPMREWAAHVPWETLAQPNG